MKISLTTKAVFGLVAIALMAVACTANAKKTYPTQTVSIPFVTETLTPSQTVVLTATLTPSPTPEPTPTLEPTPVFSIDLTHNPVSTTDLSGQIRQENLSKDLGHLADQMLSQAETLGIDYMNVPVMVFGQQYITGSNPNWAFYPWVYDQDIYLRDMTDRDDRVTNERHLVLTQLTAGDQSIGYVASVLVRLDPFFNQKYNLAGTDKLQVIHIVFDESLMAQVELARQNSQTIAESLIPIGQQLATGLPKLDLKENVGQYSNNVIRFVVVGPEDPVKLDLVTDAYSDRKYIDTDTFDREDDPAVKTKMLQAVFGNWSNDEYFLASKVNIYPVWE